MFLEALRRRNPSFLRAAANLHAQGAARHSLTVFAMTKQAGRNPAFCAAVRAGSTPR